MVHGVHCVAVFGRLQASSAVWFLSMWLIGWDCAPPPPFAAPPFGTCRSTCTSWIMMTCLSLRLSVTNKFHWHFPCNRASKLSFSTLFLDVSRSTQTFELIPQYSGCQLLNTSENKLTRGKREAIGQRPGGLVSNSRPGILLSQHRSIHKLTVCFWHLNEISPLVLQP